MVSETKAGKQRNKKTVLAKQFAGKKRKQAIDSNHSYLHIT